MAPPPNYNAQTLIAVAKGAGITDKTELALFAAQMAHESGGFKYDKELGDANYFAKYDGHSDLGNTQPGDGARFAGRGFIQLTGRANYAHFGETIAKKHPELLQRLGVQPSADFLIKNPDLAKNPEIAALVAVEYWNERVDRNAARAGNVDKVTKQINGGYNGLDERKEYFEKYKNNPGLLNTNAVASASAAGITLPQEISVIANDFNASNDPFGKKLESIAQQYKERKITNPQQIEEVMKELQTRTKQLYEKANVPVNSRTWMLGMEMGPHAAIALLTSPDTTPLSQVKEMKPESLKAFQAMVQESGIAAPQDFGSLTVLQAKQLADQVYTKKAQQAGQMAQAAENGTIPQGSQQSQDMSFFGDITTMMGPELGTMFSMIIGMISLFSLGQNKTAQTLLDHAGPTLSAPDTSTAQRQAYDAVSNLSGTITPAPMGREGIAPTPVPSIAAPPTPKATQQQTRN